MKTFAYGLPRLGKNREYKRIIEGFWAGEITEQELFSGLKKLQDENNESYKRIVDRAPDGEMSLYDPMLDTAILCGVFTPSDLNEYYSLCRGADALEMTKWFNTNYHYLVTDFARMNRIKFKLNYDHFSLTYKRSLAPFFIGPFTFLKLSKGISSERFNDMFNDLTARYKELISKVKHIYIEEPAFVMELTADEIDMIKRGYESLSEFRDRITLITYYDDVDWIEDLLLLPVSGIGLDFVRGEKNFDYICRNGFPDDKNLIAGIVDGRNVWRNDVAASLERLKKLSLKVRDISVSNAAPLYHLPVSLERENDTALCIKENLAFALEKLKEIKLIADCFNGHGQVTSLPGCGGINKKVRKRTADLKEDDFIKTISSDQRRVIHDKVLDLPLFPTTTIGSFPQTAEVRKKRADLRKGKITQQEYDKYINSEIDKLVAFQERLGLDVLVHGEYERTDMVEFFAQKLNGIATTESGWIISYGTRCYRPPIIFGDISRDAPMTLKEIAYAQSKTQKPVKGMLTGSVTIIAWSFCREDVSVQDVAYQISLCLRDEINDYEKAGIKIVQVDEAAFREKAPIKKRNWAGYFDWAVKSFNLATNTAPATQIHTHMCYSEFGEIIEYINEMDFDVISIEASRSRGDIIKAFETIDFKRQIGLGVWDIHSPSVPPVAQMKDIVRRVLKIIPETNFWLNPDCGLKTRGWPEVEASLVNMVQCSREPAL